jgi:calcineurin-like phosphoesterase family protein
MSSNPTNTYDCPIIKLNQPEENYKIQPLPSPTGKYPYRLDSNEIIALPEDKFSFHVVGDTGGVRFPEGQKMIASQMYEQIIAEDAKGAPAFLYHLGDVVYHYGEAEQYNEQFFKPYAQYPGPIFAIAGNHDSDVNPSNPIPYHSLDAFKAVFCDSERREISFSEDKRRKSMVQPNIYWTLQTPLANIIGLHSNVPKYGFIDDNQRSWFIEELKAAGKEQPGKLIIITVHHAPYSADVNHGSSLAMITFLENAFEESGVRPDFIMSGHVHNYQRFHKTYPDGKVLPSIVCGAGGFDELHALAQTDDTAYSDDNELLKKVKMQNYSTMKHGFLKITLEKIDTGVLLMGKYFTLMKDNGELQTEISDQFEYIIDRNFNK